MAIPAIPTAHPNHRFRVEIDGAANLDFSEVILPEARTDVVEYREGGNVSPRKISGPVHYSNLILRRGVTTSNDLFNWWKTVADGQMNRRNMAIILLDEQRNEVKRWNIHDAWPTHYLVSPLIARDGETVVTETLECAVDRFETAS
jgi:phage tail-like protein